MNSKLPVDVLGRIWDMSDIDKDGYLDRDEFAVVRNNPVKYMLIQLNYTIGFS